MELTKEQIFKLYEAVEYKPVLTFEEAQKYLEIHPNERVDLSKGRLREFDDMTEEEFKSWESDKLTYDGTINTDIAKASAVDTIYLLSIGIDLFGAIEKGYAERITE